jgi:hypothetical protein
MSEYGRYNINQQKDYKYIRHTQKRELTMPMAMRHGHVRRVRKVKAFNLRPPPDFC